MAWNYTGEVISCTFTGTNFTNADFSGTNTGNMYLVALAAPTAAVVGAPVPVVVKTSGTSEKIYGDAVGIDGDGTTRDGVEGTRRVSVVRGGTVYITGSGTPDYGDIGKGIQGDATVAPTDGEGRGTIIGVTGTAAGDKFIVDLDADPTATS